MTIQRLLGLSVLLLPPLVGLAISSPLPDPFRTYHPTFLKQFVFHTGALVALWASLCAFGQRVSLKAMGRGLCRLGPAAWMAALGALALLSPLWSAAPGISLRAAIDVAFWIAWAGVVAFYVRRSGGSARVVWAVGATAALAAVWGLASFWLPVQADPRLFADPAHRLMLPLGNPNFMAGLLVVGIVAAVSRLLGRDRGRAAPCALAACIVLMAAALVWTHSEAGFIALAVGLGALALVKGPRWLRRGAFACALAGCLLAMAVLVQPTNRLARRFAAVAMAPASTTHARPFLWMAAVDMVRERPLLGRGMGGFLLAHPTFRPPEANLYHWASDRHFDIHPHNEWLDWAVELGLVGLVVYVALLVSALSGAWRWLDGRRDAPDAWAVAAAMAGVVGLQALGMFGVGLRYWDLAPFHWALVGVLVGAGAPRAAAAEPARLSKPLCAALATSLLALWLAHPIRGYMAEAAMLRVGRAHQAGEQMQAARHSLLAGALATYYEDVVRAGLLGARVLSNAPGWQEAALDSWRRVDALAPGLDRAKLRIGALLLQQGKPAEAAMWLDAYLRANPYRPAAHHALAAAHEALGDLARTDHITAARHYRLAFGHQTQRLTAAAKLARAEAALGHAAEAQRWLGWLRRKRIDDVAVLEIMQQAKRPR